MTNQPEQLRADDAVLGELDSVKRWLKSSDEVVRIAALQSALEYEDAGLDLVIAALKDENWRVVWAAYNLLEQRTEPKVQEVLRSYGLTHIYEVVTVNHRGKIVQREQKQTCVFRERVGNAELDLVPIPGGCYMMGASAFEKGCDENESPQHKVSVPSFWIGQYPVTQVQYEAVMGKNPSRFKDANRPVEGVNWHDAQTFCDRLSTHTGRQYRLPSEAEWEYACRAGTTTPFHYGETLTTDLANYRGTDWTYLGQPYPGNYGCGSKGQYRGQTMPVGSFAIANAFGLYDMHGNVWEWCLDPWHENYESAPTDGSDWVIGGSRNKVIRGGSWFLNPIFCRSACRDFNDPDDGFGVIGFRVVCSLEQSSPSLHEKSTGAKRRLRTLRDLQDLR